MNCLELQRSLTEIEDGSSTEQQAHLRTCAVCSALVGDLNLIAAAASELRAADDPSPRVWNSLEIALRQEGLVHPPRPARSLLPALGTRWVWARWLVPAAAALLIVVGIYVREQFPREAPLAQQIALPPGSGLTLAMDDNDLLQEIADQSPVVQAQYADNLRRVNEYIHDAQGDVEANPNDGEARRTLAEAYQQKAMLFELAMDRSLP